MNHGIDQTGKHEQKYWVRACVGITLLSASFALISADVEAAHPLEHQIVSYLKGNVWPISGLPKSYSLNDLTYWDSAYKLDESNGYMNVEQARTDVGREQERLIVKNGLNLYDGSCWQIALGLTGDPENISLANYHTRHLQANQTFQWSSTRGTTKTTGAKQYFYYGDERVVINESQTENAFYFRTISEVYQENDAYLAECVGITNTVKWMDWKPITGENAWCGYIGPMQNVYFTYGGGCVPWNDPNITIAYDLLVAVEAMQNEIGAFYHAPSGTAGKQANEISNENNFSIYAGLKMFREVLRNMNKDDIGNLLRNSGFSEAGPNSEKAAYWNGNTQNEHGGTAGETFRSAEFSHDGDGYCAGISAKTTGSNGSWWQDFPMKESQKAVVDGWLAAKNDWSAQKTDLCVKFYSDSGSMQKIGEQRMAVNTDAEGWQEVSMVVTAPANTVWARWAVETENHQGEGVLLIDELSARITPVTLNIAETIARVDRLIEKQEEYFRNYLFNETDGVFFTGGNYDTNNQVFSPFVFNPYAIGMPYRGSNTFSGKTLGALSVQPFGYSGTNLYNGYDSVQVDVWTEKPCDMMNIQWNYLIGWVNMAKLSDRHFQYTIPEYGEGDILSYRVTMLHGGETLKSGTIRWTISISDEPKPYTSTCKYLFAVDCQTWGMAALGAQFIDENLGEGTAFEIWQNTKKYGGYYVEGFDRVHGVGFSDINNTERNVCSAEWTFGAILMCRQLAKDYLEMGRDDFAKELLEDADSMRAGVEALRVDVEDIQTVTTSEASGNQFTWDRNWAQWGSPAVTNTSSGLAYRYSNRRYEIPFGWWANPLPSLASTAWAIMNDRDFNPFELGGKSERSRRNTFLKAEPRENTVTLKTVNAIPGDRYLLQSADSLKANAAWTTLRELTGGIEPIETVINPQDSTRFFRLVRVAE